YPIRRPDVMALIDLYGVSDKRRRDGLLRLAEEVWQKGWWDGYGEDIGIWPMDYVWLENRADEIRTFDVVPVHGLLQTRGYAEAVIRAVDPDAADEQVERWVGLRMDRQRILDRSEPPRLSAIVDEAVLRRAVGGPAILRAQMEHLVHCVERSNIEIRVLPFSAGAHASPDGAFRILKMADPLPEVAYVESPAGAVYVETPEADRLFAVYDRLWGMALGTRESAKLISAVAKESR
ncbi:MAG: DUF5753 domain-containing protein, partial [Streptosporangiaceae bacterium]